MDRAITQVRKDISEVEMQSLRWLVFYKVEKPQNIRDGQSV